MSALIRRTIIAVVALLSAVSIDADIAMAQGYLSGGYDFSYGEYSGYSDSRPRIRTEWGIGIVGVHTSMADVSSSDVKLQPRIAFGGHIDMGLCIGRNFAIEAEVGYEGGSVVAATERVERRVRTRTINIPVLLSLRMVNSRIRLDVGPMFTVMSRAEYTLEGETMFFGPIYPTWNIAAGVGIRLGRHFIVEARYIHGLNDNVNQYDGLEFTTRTRRITAGVTLVF